MQCVFAVTQTNWVDGKKCYNHISVIFYLISLFFMIVFVACLIRENLVSKKILWNSLRFQCVASLRTY